MPYAIRSSGQGWPASSTLRRRGGSRSPRCGRGARTGFHGPHLGPAVAVEGHLAPLGIARRHLLPGQRAPGYLLLGRHLLAPGCHGEQAFGLEPQPHRGIVHRGAGDDHDRASRGRSVRPAGHERCHQKGEAPDQRPGPSGDGDLPPGRPARARRRPPRLAQERTSNANGRFSNWAHGTREGRAASAGGSTSAGYFQAARWKACSSRAGAARTRC